MRHWIPPWVTYKMAVSTARLHRVRGRPPLVAAGITSVIHSHSSAVRSLGYGFSFLDPFYTTHEDFSDRLSGPGFYPQHAVCRTAAHGLSAQRPRRRGSAMGCLGGGARRQ